MDHSLVCSLDMKQPTMTHYSGRFDIDLVVQYIVVSMLGNVEYVSLITKPHESEQLIDKSHTKAKIIRRMFRNMICKPLLT